MTPLSVAAMHPIAIAPNYCASLRFFRQVPSLFLDRFLPAVGPLFTTGPSVSLGDFLGSFLSDFDLLKNPIFDPVQCLNL